MGAAVSVKVVRQDARGAAGAVGTVEAGADPSAAARRARFGSLPGRVRFEDMVEEQVVPKDPARDAYAAAGSLISYACLALDLGL